MKTNHINVAIGYASGRVYCYKYNEVVKLDDKQWKRCYDCHYLNGIHSGDGVECSYDDQSHRPQVIFHDPADSEKWSRYVEVRLGVKTREEVDAELMLHSTLESKDELAL